MSTLASMEEDDATLSLELEDKVDNRGQEKLVNLVSSDLRRLRRGWQRRTWCWLLRQQKVDSITYRYD